MALWQRLWGDASPFDSRVPAERWVRFHSLPGAQRYPATEDQLAVVLERHRAVLERLRPRHPLVVLIEDYAEGDWSADWHAGFFPAAEEWRDFGPTNWWVDSVEPDLLGPVLSAIAQDDRVGSIVLTDDSLEWRYRPYDGGADVIARTAAERDSLRGEFSEWLSPRPDGL